MSDRTLPNSPTERAQMKSCLMDMDITVDGGGHLLRTNTLLCRCICEMLSFVLIWLAKPHVLDGLTHVFIPTEERNKRP